MLTSSGSEGITLRNTRYVHITEPYWNYARIEQIVGRARRICSHKNLPIEQQTVKVFFYIAVFTEKQKSEEGRKMYRAIMDADDGLTTDEMILNIAKRKYDTNIQIMKAIKETAIDCKIHGETLNCYRPNAKNLQDNDVIYQPNYKNDKRVMKQVQPPKI